MCTSSTQIYAIFVLGHYYLYTSSSYKRILLWKIILINVFNNFILKINLTINNTVDNDKRTAKIP
jgi:hypothetical protein